MLFCCATFEDSETLATESSEIQLKCQNIFALRSHLLYFTPLSGQTPLQPSQLFRKKTQLFKSLLFFIHFEAKENTRNINFISPKNCCKTLRET